jgi:hypothetical protein
MSINKNQRNPEELLELQRAVILLVMVSMTFAEALKIRIVLQPRRKTIQIRIIDLEIPLETCTQSPLHFIDLSKGEHIPCNRRPRFIAVGVVQEPFRCNHERGYEKFMPGCSCFRRVFYFEPFEEDKSTVCDEIIVLSTMEHICDEVRQRQLILPVVWNKTRCPICSSEKGGTLFSDHLTTVELGLARLDRDRRMSIA